MWCRTLDGRLAPFAPDELVPLNTRWCDMEPSYEDVSDPHCTADTSGLRGSGTVVLQTAPANRSR